MIEIAIKEPERRKWDHVDNGPFPLTKEQFEDVVQTIRADMKGADCLASGFATEARALLKNYGLSSFDCLMLGNVVCQVAIGWKYKIQQEVHTGQEGGQ